MLPSALSNPDGPDLVIGAAVLTGCTTDIGCRFAERRGGSGGAGAAVLQCRPVRRSTCTPRVTHRSVKAQERKRGQGLFAFANSQNAIAESTVNFERSLQQAEPVRLSP